jgi:hypothetical protein
VSFVTLTSRSRFGRRRRRRCGGAGREPWRQQAARRRQQRQPGHAAVARRRAPAQAGAALRWPPSTCIDRPGSRLWPPNVASASSCAVRVGPNASLFIAVMLGSSGIQARSSVRCRSLFWPHANPSVRDSSAPSVLLRICPWDRVSPMICLSCCASARGTARLQ